MPQPNSMLLPMPQRSMFIVRGGNPAIDRANDCSALVRYVRFCMRAAHQLGHTRGLVRHHDAEPNVGTVSHLNTPTELHGLSQTGPRCAQTADKEATAPLRFDKINRNRTQDSRCAGESSGLASLDPAMFTVIAGTVDWLGCTGRPLVMHPLDCCRIPRFAHIGINQP